MRGEDKKTGNPEERGKGGVGVGRRGGGGPGGARGTRRRRKRRKRKWRSKEGKEEKEKDRESGGARGVSWCVDVILC